MIARILMGMLLVLLVPDRAQAVYDLPNDDGDCPANCRQIPWSAGSDQWNSGTLPVYTSVACGGLTEGVQTAVDNGAIIQACLDALSIQQAALIGPGIYHVTSRITPPDETVLRGSGSDNCSQGSWLSTTFNGDTGVGATCTTLKLGSSSAGIELGITNPAQGSELSITSGFSKGSTVLTMASTAGLIVGDWVSVYADTDVRIVLGKNGSFQDPVFGCSYCGNNSGSDLIQQYAEITNISGSDITISRPIYWDYPSDENPAVREVTWQHEKTGVEDLKIFQPDTVDIGDAFIDIRGCLFCWAKSVETYNAGAFSSPQGGHIDLRWSHGAEVRDSYVHFGQGHNSGRTYGIYGFFWNSDHKIENNIVRTNRHSFVLEGGGSGIVYLYNYHDDDFEDEDKNYLGSARTNHAPHPMWSLWEGNQMSHLEADDVFGSSSHMVYFRNWFRAEETDGPERESVATFGYGAIDIRGPNHYYSAVGNILGVDTWTTGQVRTDQDSECDEFGTRKTAYSIGCQDPGDYPSGYDSLANTTVILHGNYDYISDAVAYWEGGADHVIKDSMYYSSKPSYFGTCAWPPFQGAVDAGGPTIQTLPAKDRYDETGLCVAVQVRLNLEMNLNRMP